ncbi:MAG: hypothetical protein JKY55_12665 [Aliivibrio sp.]|uniref:hypothetical protein n=1 Tax=Aliivibrio sp. TaxID=1872443 RepID=UPI001A4D58CE|nr:hypothetical protein [Aliivibrio sp.]
MIVCGSCLDFFEVKEKLAVGRVGSMHDLLALHHGSDELVTLLAIIGTPLKLSVPC